MARKKMETTPDLEVQNVETPEVKEEKKKEDNQQSSRSKKFKFTKDDVCLGSVIISLCFLVLVKFFAMLGITAAALYIVFFVLGMVLVGISCFFVFTGFRKERKASFTVELLLNLIALVLWFLVI